jgi:hypothetical protein
LCHEQDVRIDEGKMLSERENFDWGDLKRDGERVVFSLPPVVKTLRRFAEERQKGKSKKDLLHLLQEAPRRKQH